MTLVREVGHAIAQPIHNFPRICMLVHPMGMHVQLSYDTSGLVSILVNIVMLVQVALESLRASRLILIVMLVQVNSDALRTPREQTAA